AAREHAFRLAPEEDEEEIAQNGAGDATGTTAATRASSTLPSAASGRIPTLGRALARMPLTRREAPSGVLARSRAAASAQNAQDDETGEDDPSDLDERAMSDRLGALAPWDRYFRVCENAITGAFYGGEAAQAGLPVTPLDDLFGVLFLE